MLPAPSADRIMKYHGPGICGIRLAMARVRRKATASDLKNPGDPFEPEQPKTKDNALYPDKYFREISITKAQYEAMRKFGENPAAGGL